MGKFYVFEGDNGTGKSTLSKILADHIGARLYKTPPAEFEPIRDFIHQCDNFTKFLYYISSVSKVSYDVSMILNEKNAVCDRYFLSSVVDYLINEGLEVESNRDLIITLSKKLVIPDKTFLLLTDHKTRIKRIMKRPHQERKWDDLSLDYGIATNSIYSELKELKELSRSWEIINNNDISIEELSKQIIEKVEVDLNDS